VNVLYLAMSSARITPVAQDATHVVETGGTATILTTKVESWPDLPDGVSLVSLAEAESSHWFLRGERLLVFRLPALVLRLVRKVLALASRAPGPAGAAARSGRDVVERGLVAQQRAASRFHKERFGPFYRNLRPFVLWRVAKRRALWELDLAAFDAVVVADSLSTSLGWQIANAAPDVEVGFDLIRDRQPEDAA
jgi:hypothetical protein